MSLEIYVPLLLCLLARARQSQAANIFSHSMEFTNVNFTYNPNYYTNVSAWVAKGAINMDLITTKVVGFGLWTYVDTQISLSGGGDAKKYQTLFAYDLDLCKLMNQQIKESLLKNWFRSALKYGNLMENCPMLKGHYYINDFKLEAGSIPAYLRIGNYRFNIRAYFGKRNTKTERMMMNIITDLRIF